MNLFLKVAVAIVLLALLVSALLSVLASLLSTVSPGPFPRLADPDDGEPGHDGLEGLADGRD